MPASMAFALHRYATHVVAALIVVPVLGITPELALARMRAAGVANPALDHSIEEAAQRSHTDPVTLLVAVLNTDKTYQAETRQKGFLGLILTFK